MPVRDEWITYADARSEFAKRIEDVSAATSFFHHAVSESFLTVKFEQSSNRVARSERGRSEDAWCDFDSKHLTPDGARQIDFESQRARLELNHLALVLGWDRNFIVLDGVKYNWLDIAKIFGRKGIGGDQVKNDSWARLTQALFTMALQGQFERFESYKQFKKEVEETLNSRGNNLHTTSFDIELKQIWGAHGKAP